MTDTIIISHRPFVGPPRKASATAGSENPGVCVLTEPGTGGRLTAGQAMV